MLLQRLAGAGLLLFIWPAALIPVAATSAVAAPGTTRFCPSTLARLALTPRRFPRCAWQARRAHTPGPSLLERLEPQLGCVWRGVSANGQEGVQLVVCVTVLEPAARLPAVWNAALVLHQ